MHGVLALIVTLVLIVGIGGAVSGVRDPGGNVSEAEGMRDPGGN